MALVPLRPGRWRSVFHSKMFSTAAPAAESKIHEAYLTDEKIDIENIFRSNNVRSLLNQLTGFDLEKIFAAKKKAYQPPTYKLMTDKQLDEAMKASLAKARRLMQMPPVMRKRKPCDKVIKKDPEIQGLYDHPFIFTDISFGYSDRKRLVSVREPQGILRTATWEERDRMIQGFFPRISKELEVPKMFDEPHLSRVLDKEWYIFVLDRACGQFEPDDPKYLVVTHKVFDHLRFTKKFNQLRSTRHFGPMCFYYAVTKKGDPLLLELILTSRLEDASAFVKLVHAVHPDSRSLEYVNENSTPVDFIKAYIKADAQSISSLELALQTCLEFEPKQKKQEKV